MLERAVAASRRTEMKKEDAIMRFLQAGALLVVGALGAVLFMKMSGSKEQPVPAVQAAPASPAAAIEQPVAREEAVPEPPPARPARSAQRLAKRPSPVPSAPTRMPEAAPPQPVSAPAPVSSAPVQTASVNPPESAPPPVFRPEPVQPPPPPPRQVTIPAGSAITVRLVESLSSENNHPGDTFTATLDSELVADGFVIAEKGARVEGKIVNTQKAGKVKGLSQLSIELTQVTTSDGQHVRIHTDSFDKEGPESKGKDAAKIGAGAAIGAAIGAIAGGGKGAAIGAGAGGAAGTGGVLLTRGKPATLPSETKISFRLSDSVTVTERQQRR
jgi:hypothetical protein